MSGFNNLLGGAGQVCKKMIIIISFFFLIGSNSWALQPEKIAKGGISALTISSDKQNILFFDENKNKQGKFYSYSPKNKSIQTLSKKNFSNIGQIRWSPDRTKIIYNLYKSNQCWIYNFTSDKLILIGENIIPHDWSPDQTKILCSRESTSNTAIKTYDLLIHDISININHPLGIVSHERWSQEAFWIGEKILYVYPRTDVRNVKAELIDLQNKTKQIFAEGVYGPKNTISKDMSKIIFGLDKTFTDCFSPLLKIKDFTTGKMIDLPINTKASLTGWLSENEIIYFSKCVNPRDKTFSTYRLDSQNIQSVILNDIDIPFEIVVKQNSREIFFTANFDSQANAWSLYRIKM